MLGSILSIMNARKTRYASPCQTAIYIFRIITLALTLLPLETHAKDGLPYWRVEFPNTKFNKRAIDISDVRPTGARRDAIPPIWRPTFIPAIKIRDLGEHEPVISLRIGSHARAYPIRIMLWHEIVHDLIDEMALLVTYCALNNSSIVFERKLAGARSSNVILFGNTGRLRNFDTIMYDRKTETWWQRYTGRAIIGELVGSRLSAVPSRLEAFGRFRQRHPEGKVLVPNKPTAHHYGSSPYIRMDSSEGLGLEIFTLPTGILPYDRVVVVGRNAWTLKMLKERRVISDKGVVLRWLPGQNSIHDTKIISFGRDVGNVTVQHFSPALKTWQDAIYNVPFAYALKAFSPDSAIHFDIPQTKNE